MKKTLGLDNNSEFYQTFKEAYLPVIHTLFQKNRGQNIGQNTLGGQYYIDTKTGQKHQHQERRKNA